MKPVAAILAGVSVAGSCVFHAHLSGQTSPITVSTEAALAIGELDGPDEYIFQSVTRALALPDGRIAVADGGLKVVRIYDERGVLAIEMGGAGAGPGEFLHISDMWLDETGQLTLFDAETLRLTRFGADGTLSSSQAIQPPSSNQEASGAPQMVLGGFSDGSVGLAWLAGGGRFTSGTTAFDRFVLARFDREGAFAGLLGESTFFERAIFANGNGGPVPFSPIPYWAVRGDSLYFADGRAAEVEVRGRDGTVGRTIPMPTTAQDVDAAFDALVGELDPEHPFHTPENLRGVPRPEAIPVVSGVLVDDQGFVWVRAYRAPHDALWMGRGFNHFGGTWWVFDPDGAAAATVVMPENVRPLDIVGDRLIGVSRDALDVERVVVHALERP